MNTYTIITGDSTRPQWPTWCLVLNEEISMKDDNEKKEELVK